MADEIPAFDPDGPALIYVAVADHIAQRIAAGELQPGERLTPERELATQYRVAYLTVRRAMKELRERGLIDTVQGRGTFVRRHTGQIPPSTPDPAPAPGE